MNLTAKQDEVLRIAKSGHNLYIGGQAGSGKSFILNEIVTGLRQCGKNVSVTCTTGIACSSLDQSLRATTLHKWSGIEDDRYNSQEICNLIKTSPKFSETHSRVLTTDVLVIDEISMLSAKLFEQLHRICSLKSETENKAFGGMQVIISGDFLQLPPVPNPAYNDDGKYCFLSPLFKEVFPHKVFLSEVMRQRDGQLIQAVNEAARGCVSEETLNFIGALSRPLPNYEHTTKLFCTNYMVDSYNRKCLIAFSGNNHTEYIADDWGDEKQISKIRAPHKLWLKVGCPVILIRNLSDGLVNGLTGVVKLLEDDGPTVHFTSLNLTTKVKKIMFSVYNPQKGGNIAVRHPIPLNLAFALTVHKSQGMTLDRVEVDCQQMYQPGQLGVAMGRVKSASGLRIVNFHPSVCIPHPEVIQGFIGHESSYIEDDHQLLCCVNRRMLNHCDQKIEENFVIEAVSHADFEEYDEDELEDNFNSVISAVPCIDTDYTDFNLPESFDAQACLRELMADPVLTPMQRNVNNQVLSLITEHCKERLQDFCKREFFILTEFLPAIDLNSPQPVKPDELTQFYTKCHTHQTSSLYRMNCMLLFPEEKDFTDVHAHICYNVVVLIRKFLLQEKADIFPISRDIEVSKRQSKTGSLAKVRYVAGYCVSKVRYKYLQIQRTHEFATTSEGQQTYEWANQIVKLLDSVRETEEWLKMSTSLPETIVDITRKQNIRKGLFHISDSLYEVFLYICEQCLQLLNDRNVIVNGSNIHQIVASHLLQSQQIHQMFVSVICTCKRREELSLPSTGDIELTVKQVLVDMTMDVSALNTILSELVKKFLMVMLNQFRKDMLQALSVEKKMAHRKQVQIAGKKKEAALKAITFQSILEDKSPNKTTSHHLLKGLILKNTDTLSTMKKLDLLVLCKAYGLKIKSSSLKGTMCKQLSSTIIQADKMPVHTAFGPTVTPRECVSIEPVPGTSQNRST